MLMQDCILYGYFYDVTQYNAGHFILGARNVKSGHWLVSSFHLFILLLLFFFQDIQLGGLGILHEHCQMDIEDNEVYATPLAKTG